MVVSRQVAAPPERVWRVMTDMGSWTEVLRGVTKVEVLSGPTPLGVGTRWRETRRIAGREASEEMYVTDVQPQRSYTVEADSGSTHYVTRFELQRNAEGTEVSMSFGAEVGGGAVTRLAARAMARVGEKMVRKQLVADLDDVAAAAVRG